MQLFNTTVGVARREGDTLHLLDVPPRALEDALRSASLEALARAPRRGRIPLRDARFLPPLRPGRIIIVGLNYRSHVQELGRDAPKELLFSAAEPGDAVIASGDPIVLPASNPEAVDYEAEIALIIGSDARNVSLEDGWKCISGVTAANDVSARDLQMERMRQGDMTSAKLLPSFKPLGPGVLDPEEARRGLEIRTLINGEQRQSAPDTDMLFPIPAIVAEISSRLGLRAGDVILTGSPAGVGFTSKRFLAEGDEVEIFVGALPPLRNPVVAIPGRPS